MGWPFGLSFKETFTKENKDIIRKIGSDNIMINSAADWGISDPLSVPLVAREMRKEGFRKNEIEKVTMFNAYDFYKQSNKFTWSPQVQS